MDHGTLAGGWKCATVTAMRRQCRALLGAKEFRMEFGMGTDRWGEEKQRDTLANGRGPLMGIMRINV
uniref:Uncharacterized protein n=1 Tax=Globodera pallida TaxID=36090 RepID=A0A183C1A6_GLOPA